MNLDKQQIKFLKMKQLKLIYNYKPPTRPSRHYIDWLGNFTNPGEWNRLINRFESIWYITYTIKETVKFENVTST